MAAQDLAHSSSDQRMAATTAMPDILNRAEVPFDAARADRLMEEAGIDVLLATSKHNTCYLLGGYGFIFFSAFVGVIEDTPYRPGDARCMGIVGAPEGHQRDRNSQSS